MIPWNGTTMALPLTRDTFAILGGLDVWKDYNFLKFSAFSKWNLNFRSVWPSRPPRCSLFICLVYGIRCVWHAALKVVCFDFYPTPITSGNKGGLISESFSTLTQISKNLLSIFSLVIVFMGVIWYLYLEFEPKW